MNRIIFMFGLALTLAACAADPIPSHIQSKVNAIPAEQLPPRFFVERESCGGSHGDEKEACREQVRRDYLARTMMLEEAK